MGDGSLGASGARAGRRAVVVVNAARASRVPGLRARITHMASTVGWPDPQIVLTTREDAGTGLARQAVADGADLVVAVGGDGTVRACAQALAGTDVRLGIVPAGSANLVARALGVPRGLGAALAVAFLGTDRRIDVLSADGLVCASMAGMGVDAAVVAATPGWLKRRAGWPAYAAASARQLLDEMVEFSIRLDNDPPLRRRARSVVVGNTGQLPGGFPILPAAVPDDGQLDVAILAPASLVGWVSVGYRAVRGSIKDDVLLERLRARRVDVTAARALPRQVDGEVIAASAELSAAVVPGALVVKVPWSQPAPDGSRPD
jgi:diacylglycerol kinase family enzyme